MQHELNRGLFRAVVLVGICGCGRSASSGCESGLDGLELLAGLAKRTGQGSNMSALMKVPRGSQPRSTACQTAGREGKGNASGCAEVVVGGRVSGELERRSGKERQVT